MNHKNILIIIDNQNGFNNTKDTNIKSNRIGKLTNANLFDYQIATQYFNNLESPTNLFTRLQNWNYLTTKQEIDYVPTLKYDISLKKDIYSAINDEMLNELKKANDNKLPKYVFLCGMDTECCVLKSCVDLFEKGIIPILLNKYTSSNSGYFAHRRGLLLYKRLVCKKGVINQLINSKEDILNIVNTFSQNI